MREFCTLFDRSYLNKGLSLHGSLVRHCSEPFLLHILALDDATFWILHELELSNVRIIRWDGFEAALNLGPVRANRTWAEYCWTCASQLVEFLLPGSGPGGVTYLDSDLFFFSDPKVAFAEIGDRSLGITPHRLIATKKHLEINGLFNVGFVFFKNDSTGRHCSQKWASQCRQRCSANIGCGDQQYLNDWPATYQDQCCVIENVGVNCGPWSIGNWIVTGGPRVNGAPVICYHFHEFLDEPGGRFRLTNYNLRQDDIDLIYVPYILANREADERILDAEAAIAIRRASAQLQGERA